MSAKTSLSNRVNIGLALFIVFLLVFATNRLDQRHFNTVQDTLTTIYSDRVVAQDYVYKMSNVMCKKHLKILDASLVYSQSNLNKEFAALIDVFSTTKFTSRELRTFEELKEIEKNFSNWTRSHGGFSSMRFSSLNLINKNNVKKLKPVWKYFSKDGKMIAFTAQYDGNVDVYVIPSEGGEPKRLTYHPSGDFVQGWTPDGKILFRSGREGRPTQTNKFYTVSKNGGLPKAVDIPRAAYGEISPDGKHVAYTPITSWDAEWRNYRGGQAMPIWIVNMRSKKLIRTPQKDQERHLDPVWHNGSVYYLSERDYTSNIWSFNPKTSEEKQITFHKKFDVKSLDANPNGIVYEQGGYIHFYNPNNNSSKQLVINVKGDLNYSRPRWMNVTGRNLTNANLSPKGKRAIFEYRGDIFTVPKENGTWRNITSSSNAADRSPVWSPKGDKIAWFSDANGEYQLMISDQNGTKPQNIKLPNPTFYFRPEWSPDGKYIAFTDTHFTIWIINLETKELKEVDSDGYAHPNRTMNPQWSPDGEWIAYAKQNNSSFKSIFAYQLSTGKIIQLTDPIADAITPVWDASGKYIYTLASTNYGLQTGWLDMSSYDPSVTRSLYAIVLNKDDKAPNLPKTDEEEVKEEKRRRKRFWLCAWHRISRPRPG